MTNQTMVFNEFTFPAFTDHSSMSHLGFLGFDASSFWYASPMVVSNCYQGNSEQTSPEEDYDFTQNTAERKSFVIDDGCHDNSSIFHEVDESFGNGEYKMDMLWEDFNDELGRSSFVRDDVVGFNRTFSHSMLGYKFDVISPLKMSRRSTSSINRPRRLSLRLILKVLKKLLLLSRSRCPKCNDM
ncbi:hypothetical protein MRB53_016690 [Persea americana]|uniref:Uncharacterized protein n=1 Tax=Persea americana TaxID=3435 RepID=A0ACC2M3T6_PERAE|nr:hypothetical protein MRB53_016690 [Persea americana]